MALARILLGLALVSGSLCNEDVKQPAAVPLRMPAARIWDQNASALLDGIEETGLYRQLIFGSMQKRQSCDSGYAQCLSHPSLCCPDTPGAGCCDDNAVCVSAGQNCCAAASSVNACDVGQQCCQYGCAPEGSECCSDANRYCNAGYQCCDNGGCAPEGAQCCQRGTDGKPAWCERGNRCYESDTTPNGIQCCTDSACTAYVEGGTTVSATSAAPEPTTQIIDTVYYTFSWTWSYYAYFYTVYLQESTIDSTLRYTTTTFSVQATDSSDASSRATAYAAEVSPTPPPDASTQLRTYSPEPSGTASAETAALTGGGSGGGVAQDTVTVTASGQGPTQSAVAGNSAAAKIEYSMCAVIMAVLAAMGT